MPYIGHGSFEIPPRLSVSSGSTVLVTAPWRVSGSAFECTAGRMGGKWTAERFYDPRINVNLLRSVVDWGCQISLWIPSTSVALIEISFAPRCFRPAESCVAKVCKSPKIGNSLAAETSQSGLTVQLFARGGTLSLGYPQSIHSVLARISLLFFFFFFFLWLWIFTFLPYLSIYWFLN